MGSYSRSRPSPSWRFAPVSITMRARGRRARVRNAAGDVVAERFESSGSRAGGMGTVFRARDRLTGEAVALKVLRAERGDGRRFAREARVLAELRHPGIVRYVAHGNTPAAQLYLAMEWLEGENLARRGSRARGSRSRESVDARARASPRRSARRTRAASSTATSSRATSSSSAGERRARQGARLRRSRASATPSARGDAHRRDARHARLHGARAGARRRGRRRARRRLRARLRALRVPHRARRVRRRAT